MFSLREFILETAKEMIGNEPDYKIKEYVAGWLDKGVLTENDLAEIKAKIAEKNTAENTPSSVENSVESTEIQEEILTEEPLILE